MKLYYSERYEENVSKLRCFKGVDTLSTMTIQVETSDFNRFPNAKAYASFTALTCGEQSSGVNVTPLQLLNKVIQCLGLYL